MRQLAEHPESVPPETLAGVLTALTQAPLGVAIFDRDMRYLAASAKFLTDQDLPGDTPLLGRVHYEVFPNVPQHWRDIHALALRTGQTLSEDADIYVRRDGTTEWLRWLVKPWRKPDGEIGGLVLYTEIVTAAVEAKSHLRLLVDELNHRVKNTLAMVQSMASQTLRVETDPRAAFDKFEGRLLGLSQVHELLTRQHWDGAQLREVVDRALHPFVVGRTDAVRTEGPDVWMPPNAALAVALVLHELATNAVKYGSLSAPEGIIRLNWAYDGRMLRLSWREQGGPSVVQPTKRGFGSRLIERAFRGDLSGGAVTDYDPAGLHCEITLVAPPPTTA
jgi:two-component sensor histidine kinase